MLSLHTEVYPAGFQPYFGPVFPHYAPFPPSWKGNNIYSVLLCVRNICSTFYFDLIENFT